MRIVFILTTLGIGGAENQAVSLAERMSAKGHKVMLLVLKHAESEEWPVKLPVLRLNMKKSPLGILRGLRFAHKLLDSFHPEILHSHTFPANIFLRLLRLMRTAGITINTIHNVYEGGWHRMLLYRVTDGCADCVTAISSSARERFLASRAVSPRKMILLTNGIKVDEFHPDLRRRQVTRRQMQAGKSFVWLAVGRLAPAKDYPTLLRTFAIVRESLPDTELWIAGEGDFAHLKRKHPPGDNLQDGVEDGVRLLGMRQDIAALLDAADGFVSSSAWEGMPLAVGEAMAMRKIVVATDVGGVRELTGDTGFLGTSKNSILLAELMMRAMALTPNQRVNNGNLARERILRLFSMDAKAREWEALYQALLLPEPAQ